MPNECSVAEEGKKTGPDMAEMGLEYGFKGQAGMGKGGYNSRFGATWSASSPWPALLYSSLSGNSMLTTVTVREVFAYT